MRRTAVFHLVLWGAFTGLAGTAPAAARHHAAPARAEREAPCAGLSRADHRLCESDLAHDAAAGRAREAHARGADPCAKLARSKRGTCEREVDAAELTDARPAERPRRKAAVAEPPAKAAAAKHEVQPEDLVGGVEAEAPAASASPSTSAPALRGRLAADVAVPVAGVRPRPARGAARRPAHLHEVVMEDGQSLADLARRTGVSVDDLARLNGISSVDDVPTGMTLKVPGAAPATALASVRTPPASAAPAVAPPSAPDSAPGPGVAARGDAVAAAASAAPRPAREARRALAAPGSGPRPYASLGPESSAAPASAPARVRGGRTAADAMAAYAVASARAPHLADREDARHDRFVWPVRAEVVSAYGDHGEGRRNDGVDLAARPGDAVRAAAAGEVVYAGKEIAAAGGNLVLLKHADGWVTAYSHLGRLAVGMRQTVEQGQEIAETPDAAGASVHFEVRQPGATGAKPVDPASVLPARGGGESGRG